MSKNQKDGKIFQRTHILGSTTECRCARLAANKSVLGQAKVRHHDVAIRCQQQVFELEVAVQHVVLVEVVDHFAHRFLRVELGARDRRVLVNFLQDKLGTILVRPGPTLEPSLRELLYLVLSTPEYQLG